MKYRFVNLSVFILFLIVGCQPASSPPSTESNKTDIRIRTPGVDVDVKSKNDGKKVDVDVRKKDR